MIGRQMFGQTLELMLHLYLMTSHIYQLGVLSISSKHLNFLDLELKENSRKIKLLEIGLEDRRSVDPNLCPKNRKTFLLSISAVFVMQFLLEFT